MKEINLDEILLKYGFIPNRHNQNLLLDFGKQLLAAAADNAKIKSVIKPNHFGVIEEIDKDSITSVLDAVKR